MLRLIDSYDIPSYALSYLINGDASGLQDADQDEIDNWLNTELAEFESLVFTPRGEISEFNSWPAFGPAADCTRCTIHGHRIQQEISNAQTFENTLARHYAELFVTDSEYAYSAARITPEALAAKMTAALVAGTANKDGAGIKRTCKELGIGYTYGAIATYITEIQA